MAANRATKRHEDAIIIRTSDERELSRITGAGVQAVIYTPRPLPSWLADLAAAVRTGALQIPRVLLPNVVRDEVDNWLEHVVPDGVLSREVRISLKHDVRILVDRLGGLTGASRFMVRLFTEAPTTECGFHVDSVPRGAPEWGLLRVYNGAGTEYVDPANLTSMADFYRYLGRRERLERERQLARRDGDETAFERLERAVGALDRERSFLIRAHEISVAPAGSIVAFKHIDISNHWSGLSDLSPWIHSSPMSGEPRLVVNVTAPERARRNVRQATSAISD